MTAEQVEAEVIIVGSGVAGAMTAYRLSQKGIKVAILEAGPRLDRARIVRNFTETHRPDFSAGFPNEPWAPRPDWSDENNPYYLHAGPSPFRIEYLKAVGGTTWHWSGSTPRFVPADFRLASTYGRGTDWPFGYEDLAPFYAEAEREMGVAGESGAGVQYPLPPIPLSHGDRIIAKKLGKEGIFFLSRPVARNSREYDGRSQCQGFGTCSPICPTGAQYAAVVHMEKAEKLGARVLENTRADRIIADAAGRISGIRAQRADGTGVIVRGRAYVIAANGLETPRLLLMSAAEGMAKGAANSSGLVGRNFFEHPALVCRLQMPEPVFSGRGPENIMTSFTFRDGAFRKDRPAMLLSVANRVFLHDIANDLLQKGLEPPALDAALRDRAGREVQLDIGIEQLPSEINGITLDPQQRDSAGQPRMSLRQSYGAYEEAGFSHARALFDRMAKALGAKITSVTGPWPQHHPMGMTKMGDDPRTSVVDAQCRAHDHDNLFIVSGSVFPAGGTANPTLTIAALALRAAADIAKQLKS
jgi:glucose dehydrogenase